MMKIVTLLILLRITQIIILVVKVQFFQSSHFTNSLFSTEWRRTDPRRTAVGLDFDLDALMWCMENNFENVGTDNSSRIALFHGNVLQPHEARPVKLNSENLIQRGKIDDGKDTTAEVSLVPEASVNVDSDFKLPARDIVCAFNYSCCCLHKRKELVLYFKHALDCLSKKGSIFVMDLYGGTSSERELKLQRKFPNFTYTWEQAEFDVVQRKTRISLHYLLHKPQKKIRNAFSYSWRLWSLPEIKDYLEEAGFRAIHFWIREMPDTERNRSIRGIGDLAPHEMINTKRSQVFINKMLGTPILLLWFDSKLIL